MTWAVLALTGALGAFQPAETIAAIHVQGNHVASAAEIQEWAGVAVGDAFRPSTLAEVRGRLLDTKRFHDVDVLKRFASIADPTRIALVILVDEGPLRLETPRAPASPVRFLKRRRVADVLIAPIIAAEDGQGLTYGVKLAYAGVAGDRSRLSWPLTWGGVKQAGAAFERSWRTGPVSRVEIAASVDERLNQAYRVSDRRQRLSARVERASGPLRAGAAVGWQRVTFDAARDRLGSFSADVTFDTRLDPVLPRNAVYASASWTAWRINDAVSVKQSRIDLRGYLGVVGQTTIVGRVRQDGASAALPRYLQPELGGWSSVRGFAAGTAAGDRLSMASLELQVPLSHTLSAARYGVDAFVDTGAASAVGQRLTDASWHTGSGAGVWVAVAAFHVGLSVAHGVGATTRVNFNGGFGF
jgi:outer membrane protein assembly factor BamA